MCWYVLKWSSNHCKQRTTIDSVTCGNYVLWSYCEPWIDEYRTIAYRGNTKLVSWGLLVTLSTTDLYIIVFYGLLSV